MALDDAPSAGLMLRGSVDGTSAAGTSARSAVAAHHCSHNNDAATLRPGHRGRRRSDRFLPERARFLPDRSQIPAPSVLTESQQTSSGASRWKGLPCPRPGSPPSGTPSADTENKAQRSAQAKGCPAQPASHYRVAKERFAPPGKCAIGNVLKLKKKPAQEKDCPWS